MGVVSTSGDWQVDLFLEDGALALTDVDFNATPAESGVAAGSVDEVLAGFATTQNGATYAARLTATVTLDTAEDIAFYLAAAGDARVLIDGIVVSELSVAEVVGAGPGPCPANGAAVCTCESDTKYARDSVLETLEAGEHTITIEYLHQIPDQTMALEWSVGDLGRRPLDLVVPTAASVTDQDGGGEWGGVIDWPGIAIHSILLPDGRVLTFGTPEDGSNPREPDIKALMYNVWDPKTGEHTTLTNLTETDLFCSASVIVPETGEVLIVGGDSRPLGVGNRGVNDANLFDPDDYSLSPTPSGEMEFGRWYPSALTLANGKVLVLGGIPIDAPGFLGGGGIATPEIYTPGEGFKSLYDGAIQEFADTNGWWYPRAWLGSDGKVLVVGTHTGTNEMLYKLDASGNGELELYGDLGINIGQATAAISYGPDKAFFIDNSGGLWTLDFSGPAPVSQKVGDLGAGRPHASMDIMADGTILITGGGNNESADLNTHERMAVMVDPATWTVTNLEEEALSRLYHSTSLLLPDGTVISMGGGAPGPFVQTNAEIYRPEYLFDENGQPAERIKIIDSPEDVAQMTSFTITVDDASAVERITLLKHGSSTHSFNMGAGFIEGDFTVDLASNTITITPPPNPNVFMPGSWMVFALDANGTPSEAIHVNAALGGEAYSGALNQFLTLSDEAVETTADEFQLTDAGTAENGTVATNERIDFTSDFQLDMQVRLGNDDGGGAGIAVLFHNEQHGADETGASNVNFGTDGFANAFGIEIDTYSTQGELPSDHTAFFGIDAERAYSLIGTEQNAGELEDGAWHDLTVTWDYSTGLLSYALDGVATDTLSLDPDAILGENYATLAITAGTNTAQQDVRFTGFEGLFEGDAFRSAYSIVLDEELKLVGDARLDTDGSIVLTSADAASQAGAVSIDRELDLTQNFSITFEVDLGSGGDGGVSFLLHKDADGAETLGEGTSAANGIENALRFEMRSDAVTGSNQLVTLDWNASGRSLTYTPEGGAAQVVSGAVVEQELGSADRAYLTLTGATGATASEQRIKVDAFGGAYIPDPIVFGYSGKAHFVQADATQWHKVTFEGELDNPIVVLSPLTSRGGEAAVTRVQNVTSTGFEYQIDEWDYLDGGHIDEEVRWMAIEAGVHVTADGAVIEAGRTVADHNEQQITFSSAQSDGNVVVLAQTTSYNDAAAVTDRIDNITGTGFTAFLQEEQAADGVHLPENLDWIAVSTGAYDLYSAGALTQAVGDQEVALALTGYDADETIFAELQSVRGADTAALRFTNVSDGSVGLFVEEEQSLDDETGHFAEDLGWVFAADVFQLDAPAQDLPPPPPAESVIGLSGQVNIEQVDASTWFAVTFDQSLIDPVVSMSPITMNGAQGAMPRVRNITSDGFEFQLDEWDYLDGLHFPEDFWWVAVERGVHVTADGGIIEAGRAQVDSTDTQVGLTGEFTAGELIVLGQTTSVNDATAVVDRISDVTETGFTVRLQEEEAADGIHVAEDLDYIAFSTGSFETFTAASAARAIDEQAIDVALADPAGNQAFFADIQSIYGADTSVLRINSVGTDAINLFLQEEQSSDRETGHTLEDLGWVFVDDVLLA